MKQILFLIFFICCSAIAANAQVINASAHCLTSTATGEKSYISASSLSPANGALTITAPVKFVVSLDSVTWSSSSVSISYTGGVLSPTPIYVMFAGPAGYSDWDFVNVSGGGAIAINIISCANNSSCPCYVTGVNNLPNYLSPSISILPNPVTSQLTIQSANQPIYEVVITNLLGQIVASPGPCKGENEVFIDVSRLPTGMYFAHINGSEVKKFIRE